MSEIPASENAAEETTPPAVASQFEDMTSRMSAQML